mgnify:CR=1 FL=1
MAVTNNEHVRRGRDEWQRLLTSQATSGLSQKAFCQREGLAQSTFQYWKRRLGHQSASCDDTEGPTSAASVIDLGTLEDRPAGWEVEIVLGDGVSLTLRRR